MRGIRFSKLKTCEIWTWLSDDADDEQLEDGGDARGIDVFGFDFWTMTRAFNVSEIAEDL